jgi:hypothetical protein
MKTYKTLPAFTVIDMESEIIELSRKQAAAVEIAVPYQSRNHGELFKMYKVGSVAAYAAQYAQDEQDAIDRAIEKGHKTHFVTACATSITSHKSDHEIKILARPGQLIRFDGGLLQVKALHCNLFDVELIK